MSLQTRADIRSLELHSIIARKLKENPGLWSKPVDNIERWHKKLGHECGPLIEWDNILKTWSHEQIIELITSESQIAKRLRSSSPFTGILTQEERNEVFRKYQDSPPRRNTAKSSANIAKTPQEQRP